MSEPEVCTFNASNTASDHREVNPSTLLADHTTLRVGGPAKRLVTARTAEELIEIVSDADQRGEPVLVLGDGSNLLVSDEGFDGTVVLVDIMGINAQVSDCGGAYVTVGAGESWDQFVAYAIEQEWVGIETLSGIPGRVGATPIQNVGAYGTEVSATIASVRTYDRQLSEIKTFPASDCGFGYRTSRFKQEPGRYLILSVSFQFELGSQSLPIAYPELARTLDVPVGQRAPMAEVRDAVLAIRGSKGMVLDEADHDTWSGGSFFTNPIVTLEVADQLPEEAPRFPVEGQIKTSAAWLIQHSGFDKGYGNERAALSSKHVLAVTNRGGATAADLVELASHVRDGVKQRFGIELVPEVNLVGTQLIAS